MTAVFLRLGPYFPEEKEGREVWQIVLSRGEKGFSFTFGASLLDTQKNRTREHIKKPSAYDVLSCLTKEDPGTEDEFASSYGYQDCKPSIIHNTYRAVWKEWQEVNKLFSEKEIEELRDIN